MHINLLYANLIKGIPVRTVDSLKELHLGFMIEEEDRKDVNP